MAPAVSADEPVTQRKHGVLSRLQTILVVLLVVIGSLSAGIFVVVNWSEKQVLNTDNWVSLVSPLPKQPVVYTALGSYISQQLFANVPVQQKISDALPPKASFLAGPLASQLKTITTQTAQKLVGSDTFQTIWSGANRLAMDRLLSQSRGTQTALQQKVQQKFNLDISGVAPQLRSALGSVSQAIPALQPAANSALNVTADLHSKAQRVHQVVRTIDFMHSVLPYVIVASFLSAIALSRHRRHTVMAAVLAIFILMLLEIIALNQAHQLVLNQVHNSANVDAVSYIYDTLVSGLRGMIYTTTVIAVVLEAVLFALGPARWAVSLRSLLHTHKLRDNRFVEYLHAARDWTRKWEHYLWLGAFILVLVLVALISNVTGKELINAAMLLVSLVAILHIFAWPHYFTGRVSRAS
jgi:hypothetical protein